MHWLEINGICNFYNQKALYLSDSYNYCDILLHWLSQIKYFHNIIAQIWILLIISITKKYKFDMNDQAFLFSIFLSAVHSGSRMENLFKWSTDGFS